MDQGHVIQGYIFSITGVTEGPAAPAVRGGADTRGAPAGRPPSVGFFLMNLFLHLMASEGRPRYPLYP